MRNNFRTPRMSKNHKKKYLYIFRGSKDLKQSIFCFLYWDGKSFKVQERDYRGYVDE